VEKTIVVNPTIGNMIQNDNNSISLHFRLGDYKKKKDYHLIMTVDYFRKSLEYILTNTNQNHNVYYFCEEEDIIQVEEIVEALKKSYVETFIAFQVVYLIGSNCCL
jgi:hypothetical protein